MKEIIENVRLVISMTIIGAILLYIGTSLFMPNMTIKIFRLQPFIVVTESMEPVYNVNDVVVVKNFNIDEAEVGDIITFKADIDYNGTEETITHYIYSIDRSGDEAIIRTNRYFDTGETITPDTWLIPASNVIGTSSFHVPYLGLLIGFVKSIYGIVIIALNIAIFSVIKYINAKAKKEKEEQEQQQLVAQSVLDMTQRVTI
jgi:signal peptidase